MIINFLRIVYRTVLTLSQGGTILFNTILNQTLFAIVIINKHIYIKV